MALLQSLFNFNFNEKSICKSLYFHRAHSAEEAKNLLRLFNLDQYFSYKEIYPGTKTTHINSICSQSGVGLSNVLFFDDHPLNISELTAINVCSILVVDGITMNVVKSGIQTFVEAN